MIFGCIQVNYSERQRQRMGWSPVTVSYLYKVSRKKRKTRLLEIESTFRTFSNPGE